MEGGGGSHGSACDWIHGTRRSGAPETGLLRLRAEMLLGDGWSAPAWLRQIDWLRKPTSGVHRDAMYQDELQIVSPPPPPPPSLAAVDCSLIARLSPPVTALSSPPVARAVARSVWEAMAQKLTATMEGSTRSSRY